MEAVKPAPDHGPAGGDPVEAEAISPAAKEETVAQLSRELSGMREQLARLTRKLETQDRRYRRMIENMPAMLFIQRDEVLEYANPLAVEKLAAGQADRLIGHSPFEFVAPEQHESVRGSLRKLLIAKSHLAVSTKRRLRAINGEWIHVEVSASIFEDERGEALQIVAMDVTERHRSELKRQALTRELAEANQELESLIYTASHDLRSPLLNLQGFTQWIEKEWATLGSVLARSSDPDARAAFATTAPKMGEIFSHVQCGVNRMNALLEGLLRLSRLGRAALRVEPLSATVMSALVNEVRAAQNFQIEQAAATLTIGPLPGCRADRFMLGQVFANLLDNSLKYRSPERPCEIAVTGRAEAGRAFYEIRDNGLGIAAADQPKIFEMFRRIHTDVAAGEGLGLALAQRCLGRMDGHITLCSTENEGSSFVVDLPAA